MFRIGQNRFRSSAIRYRIWCASFEFPRSANDICETSHRILQTAGGIREDARGIAQIPDEISQTREGNWRVSKKI